MSNRTRHHRSRRTTVAAAIGVVALCGSLALPAQAAFAADGVKNGASNSAEGSIKAGAKLSVQAPASIGFAGGPVEFSETVTNTGTAAQTFILNLITESALGTPPHAITIDRKNAAGKWVPLELHPRIDSDAVRYGALVEGITVPAGKSVTVKLRIAAPMGKPHAGASNGGFNSLKLVSAVYDMEWRRLAEQSRTIKAVGLNASLAKVPATAVAGGAPIEFDAVLGNPTPSGYVNLGNVLFTSPHATVQVRKADGSWTTLKNVPSGDGSERTGVYLQGRNSSLASGKAVVTRVRVSYDKNTPLGETELYPCVFVNEGSQPFRGTTHCVKGATVKVVKSAPAAPAKPAAPKPATAKPAAAPAPAKAPAAPAAPVAPATPTAPTASATPAPTGELAMTGGESNVLPAAIAATLATLGGGLVVLARRLRRNNG